MRQTIGRIVLPRSGMHLNQKSGRGGHLATKADRLGVLAGVRYVVERSRYVHVDEAAIASIAPGLSKRISVPAWSPPNHAIEATDQGINWLLVLDALNFSFWGDNRWTVDDRGENVNGFRALAAALSRASAEGIPITDPDYLASITASDLAHILRGTHTIPMLDRRVENLREVGEGLRDRFEGSFARAVESCRGSAVRLVQLLAATFPSFNDTTDYQGSEVRFYKRAQLLVSDLYGAYQGQGWGKFDDLDELTVFADYKLPQILRHMGMITYIESMAEKVDNRYVLVPGSRDEVEIRAATVWACEVLRRALASHGANLRAFELDWWLWNETQKLNGSMKPYHLARTVYY